MQGQQVFSTHSAGEGAPGLATAAASMYADMIPVTELVGSIERRGRVAGDAADHRDDPLAVAIAPTAAGSSWDGCGGRRRRPGVEMRWVLIRGEEQL